MLEKIKTRIKYKSVKVDGEDGPSAVLYQRKIPKQVITKKRVFLFVLVVALAALLSQSVFAICITESLFSEKGSEKFVETVYGDDFSELTNKNASFLKSKGELVTVDSKDGSFTALSVKNENVSSSYVIMCHTYGASVYSMGEYARHFYNLGFNIIIPQLSTAEGNDEKSLFLGTADVDKVLFWVNSLVEENEKSKIVLFGVSTGGASVTEAASGELPENVKCVIADSCYSSLWDLYEPYLENAYGISAFPIRNIASLYCEIKYDVSLKNAGTYSVVRDVEKPILFMHGENDAIIPMKANNDLYMECESKERDQEVIRDGEHARLVVKDSKKYWECVDEFILDNIGN